MVPSETISDRVVRQPTSLADYLVAAQVAEGDGYAAALVNFRFMATTVWTTKQVPQLVDAQSAGK